MTGDSIEAVADYISKVTHEITSPTTKDGRGCNRAPFRILLDFLATGNADDYDLWVVWEQTSHNRRQVTWSRALRAWAGLARERRDEEVAAQDHHGDDMFVLPPATWEAIRDGDVADLLDAIELGGVEAG
jgi:hypothetical protein